MTHESDAGGQAAGLASEPGLGEGADDWFRGGRWGPAQTWREWVDAVRGHLIGTPDGDALEALLQEFSAGHGHDYLATQGHVVALYLLLAAAGEEIAELRRDLERLRGDAGL